MKATILCFQNLVLESTPKNPLTPYPCLFGRQSPKGELPNSMIFRCSPLGLGVKHLKIIEFYTFRSGFNLEANSLFFFVAPKIKRCSQKQSKRIIYCFNRVCSGSLQRLHLCEIEFHRVRKIHQLFCTIV